MDEDQRGGETGKPDGGAESIHTIKDNKRSPIQTQADYQDAQREHFHWGLTRYEFTSTIIRVHLD
jgi:hypothetical protein